MNGTIGIILLILLFAFSFGLIGWLIYHSVGGISKDVSKSISESKAKKEFEKKREILKPEYERQYNLYCKKAENELNIFVEQNISKEFHCDFGKEHIALSKDKKELVLFAVSSPKKHCENLNLFTITPPVEGKINVISKIVLSDILFFEEIGDVQYSTTVSGGGTNLKGAVAGAIIAGAAGAIIGGRQQEITSKTEKHDSREVRLKLSNGSERKFQHKYYSAFMKLIPEKEYSFVLLNKQQTSTLEFETEKTSNIKISNPTNNHYKVVLVHTGANKSQVIVKLREALGIGLVEAKILTDKCPAVINDFISIESAEILKSEFESVGAFVSIESV